MAMSISHVPKGLLTYSLFLLFFLSISSNKLFAEELAVVTFLQGEVYSESALKPKARKKATLYMLLKKGDQILSLDGTCEISIAGKASVRLAKFSSVKMEEILSGKNNGSVIRITSGKIFTKASKAKPEDPDLNVISASFVAGVRGTEFLVSMPNLEGKPNDELELENGVYVNEGIVAVSVDSSPKTKELLVEANEQVRINGKEAIKEILNEYAKAKMEIFADFQEFKEENYEIMKEQYLKNSNLMEQMKKKRPKL